MALEVRLTWGEYHGLIAEINNLKLELADRDLLLAAAHSDLAEARTLLSKARRETLADVNRLMGPSKT